MTSHSSEKYHTHFETKEDALDLLYKQRVDHELLEELKTQIPLPSRFEGKKISIIIGSLLIGLLIVISVFLLRTKSDSPKQMALNLIETTGLTSVDDMTPRGEIDNASDENLIKFHHAVSLSKGDRDKTFESIHILTELIDSESKLKIDALWLRALAHVRNGNNILAEKDLARLSAISNYQEKNIEKLLEKIINE